MESFAQKFRVLLPLPLAQVLVVLVQVQVTAQVQVTTQVQVTAQVQVWVRQWHSILQLVAQLHRDTIQLYCRVK